MRTPIGLGLFTIVGLLACTSSVVDSAAAKSDDQGGTDVGGGPTSTATDPTDPGAAPGQPAPAADPSDPETPPAPVAAGISISDVAVFQAVKVPVVKDGSYVATKSRKAPVVAKRPGLLRVYVTPDSSFKPREITAELRLVTADKKFPIIRDTKTISGPSKDEDPSSTLNLELPGESLPPGVTFQVALTAPDGQKLAAGEGSRGRYPADGSFQDLGAELAGTLKVVIVPVKYDADRSGRTPDLGPAQLERYKKTLMQRYPTSEVQLSTHEPLPWSQTISASGSGFQQILNGVTKLRQSDNVGKDVYYYGLFMPAASFTSYCGGGCVTGLSTIVDEDAPVMRASVGIGFPDQESANTMAHEIGHAHGREHAPCGGPQGVDPRYPYPQAQLGAWGYDIFAKTFISPTKGRDMMGYCPNQWVSDYTYNALFERISAVSLTKDEMPSRATSPVARPTAAQYRVATVGAGGELAWDGDLDLDEELTGGTVLSTKYISEGGIAMMTRPGRFFRFDHLPGGFLFVPKEAALPWKAVQVDGFKHKLTR
jgi:hypothetical protein